MNVTQQHCHQAPLEIQKLPTFCVIRCANASPQGNQRCFVFPVFVSGFQIHSPERERGGYQMTAVTPVRLSSQMTPNEFSVETIRQQPCKTEETGYHANLIQCHEV